MKYYIDSEFVEDGKTIDLLSLAIVGETGLERYWVNEEADHSKAGDWVKQNVIPHLYEDIGCLVSVRNRKQIKESVLEFIGEDKPEFWGYYAAYDWVSFCQLFGAMIDLPKGYPMFCRDIIQECKRLGNPELPAQGKGEHHALADAQWNAKAHKFLKDYERRKTNLGIV